MRTNVSSLKKAPLDTTVLYVLTKVIIHISDRNVKRCSLVLAHNNDKELIKKGVLQIVVPFYQVWLELVDKRTSDVYQYRMLTALSALEEMTEVIEKTLSGLFTSSANFDACRDETLYILRKDQVLNKRQNPLLKRMQAAIGNKPKNDAEYTRLLFQLKYAITILKPQYMKMALDELKAGIQNCDIETILECSNTVASQAIHNGWSAQGLARLVRFFTQKNSFDEQWENFSRELLNTSKTEHHVLIHIPFQGQSPEEYHTLHSAFERLDLDFLSYSDLVAAYAEVQDIKTLLNRDKRYFRVVVNAYDIYSAALFAITQISKRLNLASFYNLVTAWDLKSVAIIAINWSNTYHSAFNAETLFGTHDYIDSSSKVFEKTLDVFSNPQMKAVSDKLQGTFSYTNISRASLFQEEKFINLWVALESLARTNMYSDIISSVRETVPAATCLRYIYKIVRNYVEDCRRCGVKFEFSTCKIDMEQGSKSSLVFETIKMLRDDSLFSELKKQCSQNSLLARRSDDIRKLVTDVEYAKTKTETHYKRVHWQIQRLYRIRNEITHSALQEHQSLIAFIEHLYDYLSTYISEIVSYLIDKEMKNLEEVLCTMRDNYIAFIELSKDDPLIIKESTLLTGVIDLLH